MTNTAESLTANGVAQVEVRGRRSAGWAVRQAEKAPGDAAQEAGIFGHLLDPSLRQRSGGLADARIECRGPAARAQCLLHNPRHVGGDAAADFLARQAVALSCQVGEIIEACF